MSAFGDRVRIKETPETRASGVAGLEGDVYGFTTPSVTAIEVVGGSPDDFAINVTSSLLASACGSDLIFWNSSTTTRVWRW